MFTAPSQGCDPIWLGHVQSLCILPVSMSSYVGLEDLFPWCHPLSLTLTVFLPLLPHRSLSSEGRSLMTTSNLELDVSRDSCSLHIVQLSTRCFFMALSLLWVSFLSSSQDQQLQSHTFVFPIWLCRLHKYHSACNLVSILLVLNLHKWA